MKAHDELAALIYELTTENTFFDHNELAAAIIRRGWTRKPQQYKFVGIDDEEHDRLMRLKAKEREQKCGPDCACKQDGAITTELDLEDVE